MGQCSNWIFITTDDTMTTIFLKFPTKEKAYQQLQLCGFLNSKGLPIVASHTHSLDEVGELWTEGQYLFNEETQQQETIVEPQLKEGYHFNFIGNLPSILEQYVIPKPNSPNRQFAGVD